MLRAVLALVALTAVCPPARPAAADTGGVVTATVTVAADVSITVRVSNGRLAAGIPFHIDAEWEGAVEGAETVRLHASPSLLARDPLAQAVRTNAPKARWALCSDRPGAYVVMASLEWPDGRRAESEAVVVEIAPSSKTACPKPWS